jgi:hypothetical protein
MKSRLLIDNVHLLARSLQENDLASINSEAVFQHIPSISQEQSTPGCPLYHSTFWVSHFGIVWRIKCLWLSPCYPQQSESQSQSPTWFLTLNSVTICCCYRRSHPVHVLAASFMQKYFLSTFSISFLLAMLLSLFVTLISRISTSKHHHYIAIMRVSAEHLI